MPESRYKPKTIGLPPGSLVHVGQQKISRSLLSVTNFDADSLEIWPDTAIDRCAGLKDSPSVSWINLDGLHDTALVQKLGKMFDIHVLALEDILNTQHQPKLEAFDNNLIFILKMLRFNPDTLSVEKDHLGLVVGKHYVVTFQEQPGHIFDGVHRRIENKSCRIRNHGPDYTAYALIDSVVDSYFFIFEAINDQIFKIEEDLLDQSNNEPLSRIHHFRKQILLMRKVLRPLREMLNNLLHDEAGVVQDATTPYLRDLYDHVLQLMENLEALRETLASLHDLYLSNTSHRMNEVMKILTVISTIFIPLTFIAGVYGMNFKSMPELGWRWGYGAVWLVMLACVSGMVLFFKRKKWF